MLLLQHWDEWRQGTLFRHSLPMLFLTQLSLTRMTCVTLAVSRSFGMDALSYQGLFIFRIKSLLLPTKDASRAEVLYIWETLGTHGRGSFKALVSSPGTLSRTINTDLLKIWTTSVHVCSMIKTLSLSVHHHVNSRLASAVTIKLTGVVIGS